MSEAERMAERLTPLMKKAVLEQGSPIGPVVHGLLLRGLLAYEPTGQNTNKQILTPLGLAVRAALESNPPTDQEPTQ